MRRFHSGPCATLSMTSLRLAPKPSSGLLCLPIVKSRKPLHVCLAGGQGMMENNERNSLEKAMEQFKGQSLEDILRQQMGKGGSGGKPPRGGGGGGNSGGSDNGGFGGMSDETLQVVLATIGFIFLYMNVINGLEFAKLFRDFINFLCGRGQSVRLKRALYKWVVLSKFMTERKEGVKNGLKKVSTWRFNPDFFRGVLRHHMKSN
ncbi:hypothetical protein RJT34_24468 [Clitoria ternatea]|uniref:Glycine-rich protein n=1 Tax=Clitoria ternatea TaxID=43366 RepID=A0AAN9IL92_CLITE